MANFLKASLFAFLFFVVPTSLFGETANNNHPCKALESACEAAGYFKGGAKTGHGLWKNCMHPLMNGKTVNGVTVQPTEVQACLAKKTTYQHNGQ